MILCQRYGHPIHLFIAKPDDLHRGETVNKHTEGGAVVYHPEIVEVPGGSVSSVCGLAPHEANSKVEDCTDLYHVRTHSGIDSLDDILETVNKDNGLCTRCAARLPNAHPGITDEDILMHVDDDAVEYMHTLMNLPDDAYPDPEGQLAAEREHVANMEEVAGEVDRELAEWITGLQPFVEVVSSVSDEMDKIKAALEWASDREE